MSSTKRLWSEEEVLIAINLYHKLPFGQFHSRNPTIINVSASINRTPSSLALKLSNLASLDPSLDRKGMSNYSKLDKKIWDDFYANPEEAIYKSEKIINNAIGIKEQDHFDNDRITESTRTIKQRVNQQFFRKTILASYNNRCSISGVDIKSMLVASHIIPWSNDSRNRLNPSNGICLNSLYDKAFDKGYISISTDYKILLSEPVIDNENDFIQSCFISLRNRKITLPNKFLPNKEFLEYHQENIFIK